MGTENRPFSAMLDPDLDQKKGKQVLIMPLLQRNYIRKEDLAIPKITCEPFAPLHLISARLSGQTVYRDVQ